MKVRQIEPTFFISLEKGHFLGGQNLCLYTTGQIICIELEWNET